jgi:hypothetical protein
MLFAERHQILGREIMDSVIKKILVPTDFSKSSEKAYIVAANLGSISEKA